RNPIFPVVFFFLSLTQPRREKKIPEKSETGRALFSGVDDGVRGAENGEDKTAALALGDKEGHLALGRARGLVRDEAFIAFAIASLLDVLRLADGATFENVANVAALQLRFVGQLEHARVGEQDL